jgi:hypothetical protein
LSGSDRKWRDVGGGEREHVEEIINGILLLVVPAFFVAIRRAIGNLIYDNTRRRLS